jgi:S1-C subfamily serine protease
MKRLITLALAVLLGAFTFIAPAFVRAESTAAPAATPETRTNDAKAIYLKTIRGTVMFLCRHADGTATQGSGWVIDCQRKLIVTNHHVIKGAKEIVVVFPEFRNGRPIAEQSHYVNMRELGEASASKRLNGQKLADFMIHGHSVRGYVLDADVQHDLAIVEVDALPAGTVALPLADESLMPGEKTHAIGGNSGSGQAMWVYISGTVRSVYQRHAKFKDGSVQARMIESESAVIPGDSGGPVVNDAGEVVGVTQSIEGVASFSVEVSELKTFLKAIQNVIHPETAQEFLARAQRRLPYADYVLAIDDLSEAIELNDELVEAYVTRGAIYNEIGQPKKAILDFDMALQLNEKDPRSWGGLASAKSKLGKYSAAISDIAKALALAPGNHVLLEIRAIAREGNQEFAKALVDYLRLSQMHKNNAKNYAFFTKKVEELTDKLSDIKLLKSEGD